MKFDLWQNDPDKHKSAFREEMAKTNYLRVHYLLRMLLPIALLMLAIAQLIGDALSIRVSHLLLVVGTLALVILTLVVQPDEGSRPKLQKFIVEAAYFLLMIWGFTLLGYNPDNLIAFVDVVIVIIVMAFLYISTWEKLATFYGLGLGYLFFLTPYVNRAAGYLPLLTTSVLTIIAMFFLSRVMHQYFLHHFVMKKKLETREKDLETKLEAAIEGLRSKEKAISREVIRCLVKGVEFHDGYTRGHSENVARLARSIAKELGLSYEKQEAIHLAGLVHDVGKILVPNQLLNKPGALTDDERFMIEKHSRFGYDILSESESLAEIAAWVLHHHEHWNGQGYPAGLKKEAIPLLSQVLAVADAYDAITSDRVYRKKRTAAEAIREIQRCSGTQFAPKVVAAFAKSMGHESC